ncbi:hypothetical protein IGS68_30205 (plasmid) [Skermanella sp. TT6]|uniref:VOC domain-containing protein n=1 Tax=Skermanella cutis TaxID=2775420 RepID=A0ABX7BEC4_9PROT|nr:hypothetical protein [Skermanella sp. TT6]QQP92737.1 hypothetical protein IGS68_30205 [Skermanella sp. TT6]
MTTFNAPAFRLFFNTGKRVIETGAAWPNRAGTGFNVQLDSLFGSRPLFLVPNLDRDSQPQGPAPFKVLYPTGRIRSDGSYHTRACGVAHVSRDTHGYDLYIADPAGNMRLFLRPATDPAHAANDPPGDDAATADGIGHDPDTGEILDEETAVPDRVAAGRRRRAAGA